MGTERPLENVFETRNTSIPFVDISYEIRRVRYGMAQKTYIVVCPCLRTTKKEYTKYGHSGVGVTGIWRGTYLESGMEGCRLQS
jgi:hypothetical protein